MHDYRLIISKGKMSLRKLNSLALLVLAAIAVISCKEDEDETLPYLSGLYFNCPTYVSPNQAVRMVPEGVTHPEGKELGYYWRVSPTMTTNDTTEVYVHWFSDTLGTYNVICYAFADGYTGVSYDKSVYVVKGGLDGSITNTGIKDTDPKITVDGVDYYYTRIGSLEWFRNNLMGGAGTSYINSPVTADVFGGYYTYDEAVTACPDGWRLPSEEDWVSLAAAVGAADAEKYEVIEGVASKLFADAYFNGRQMLEYWPVVGDITNESNVGFLPFGYANLGEADSNGNHPSAIFEGMYEYSVMWTADVQDQAGMAYYRYLIYDQPDMFIGKAERNSFGASVRCVRDAQ